MLMRPRSFRCAGLAASDVVLIRSFLQLISGHTLEPWRYAGEDEPVDLFLASPQFAPAEPTISRALIARVMDDPRSGATDLTLAHPFRVRALIDLLDAATVQLKNARNAGVSASDRIGGRSLAELLYALPSDSAAAHCVEFRLDDRPLMTVWTADRRFHAHASTAELLTQMHHSLSAHDIGAATTRTGNEMPLDPLLWAVGLASVHGLVGGVRRGDVITVRRWPDFSRLPHQVDHLRMIARLARAPMSTDQLADDMHVSVQDATAFVNALLLTRCVAAAAIGRGSEQAVPKASVQNASRRSLIMRIRTRLGL